jgi:branched-chain amino acid transport system substrate-binding protein
VTSDERPASLDVRGVTVRFGGVTALDVPNLPFDGNVIYGMSVAYTFVQALKAAGRNPTRSSIVSTIRNTKLTGGPGLVPFGYSSSNHLGYLGVQMATIGNGGSVSTVGPPYVSSDNGGINKYSGSPSSAPSSGIPSN